MCGPGMEMFLDEIDTEETMKEVIENIKGMIRECKDEKNSDRVREVYKKELSTIFNLIDRELHLRYAEVDGLEVSYPGEYNKKNGGMNE